MAWLLKQQVGLLWIHAAAVEQCAAVAVAVLGTAGLTTWVDDSYFGNWDALTMVQDNTAAALKVIHSLLRALSAAAITAR